MKRGVVYISFVLICIYIGILNRQKSYFYVAALMLAILLCLICSLIIRFVNTELHMNMNIPVVDKNRPFHPQIIVDTDHGQVPYVSAVFRIDTVGMKRKRHSSFRQIDGRRGRCQGDMSLSVSGRYEINVSDVRVYDAFRMFYIRKRVNEKAYIYVLPQCYPVAVEVTKKTRDFVSDSDVYHADVRGDDASETFQIREYRPGDRMTNIHWKLTARQGEIMVRDTSRSMSCPVIICMNLNGRGCKNYGQSMSVALESMVSISFALIEVKVPHFIAWYDTEEMTITRYRIMKEEDVYDAAARLSYVDARYSDDCDVIGLYRDKYRGEDYTSFIDIDMDGNIVCGYDTNHVEFRTLKSDLGNICVIV